MYHGSTHPDPGQMFADHYNMNISHAVGFEPAPLAFQPATCHRTTKDVREQLIAFSLKIYSIRNFRLLYVIHRISFDSTKLSLACEHFRPTVFKHP